MNLKTKKDLVGDFLATTPKRIDLFVEHSMAVSGYISEYLRVNKMSQKEFAELFDKKESEISKWLSGNHNFTLKTLAKLEEKLGEQFVFIKRELEKKLLPYSHSKSNEEISQKLYSTNFYFVNNDNDLINEITSSPRMKILTFQIDETQKFDSDKSNTFISSDGLFIEEELNGGSLW